MNTLLIFFALPVATIILAVILERLLRCPIAVGAIFFAIYLIVTFAAFDETFLIFAIVYTILAYIAAVITCLTRRLNIGRCLCCNSNSPIARDVEGESDENNNNDNNCECGCSRSYTNNINNRAYSYRRRW